MNQLEIAKEILEQGNCMGIGCEDNDCPFYKCDLSVATDCLISVITTEVVEDGKDMDKVKQWIKERESMIDLSVNQIVDQPVKCWVHNGKNWIDRWLVCIENEEFCVINNFNHSEIPTIIMAVLAGSTWYNKCSLTDPTIPTKKIKKWLTVEDIPVELWNNVLYKFNYEANHYARTLTPLVVSDSKGNLERQANLVYLPLGQPLTNEWLPFESEE